MYMCTSGRIPHLNTDLLLQNTPADDWKLMMRIIPQLGKACAWLL